MGIFLCAVWRLARQFFSWLQGERHKQAATRPVVHMSAVFATLAEMCVIEIAEFCFWIPFVCRQVVVQSARIERVRLHSSKCCDLTCYFEFQKMKKNTTTP